MTMHTAACLCWECDKRKLAAALARVELLETAIVVEVSKAWDAALAVGLAGRRGAGSPEPMVIGRVTDQASMDKAMADIERRLDRMQREIYSMKGSRR